MVFKYKSFKNYLPLKNIFSYSRAKLNLVQMSLRNQVLYLALKQLSYLHQIYDYFAQVLRIGYGLRLDAYIDSLEFFLLIVYRTEIFS